MNILPIKLVMKFYELTVELMMNYTVIKNCNIKKFDGNHKLYNELLDRCDNFDQLSVNKLIRDISCIVPPKMNMIVF